MAAQPMDPQVPQARYSGMWRSCQHRPARNMTS